MSQPSRISPAYRAIGGLLSPALVAHAAWQAFKAGDSRYLRQRLGWFGGDEAAAGSLWIHAASVGEIHTALPLIELLLARNPAATATISTTTPTGGAAARARLPGRARQLYLPWDWPGATRRFLRAVRPGIGLIIETEIWPALYAEARRADIPLVIINGRLSERSMRGGRWRTVQAAALQNVTAILARSETDRERFIALGAPAGRCQVVGNLKFAAPGPAGDAPAVDLGRPFVLAASTHADEEHDLARAWLAAGDPGRLLVIVPRHPQRRQRILQQLAAVTPDVAVRSRGDVVTPRTAVYLADTFGELPALIAGADAVFMGGSLVPHGGHNVLEVARAGRALVFGPHMDNFSDEAAMLLADDAAIRVGDAGEAVRALVGLGADVARRKALARRAQASMTAHADVAHRYAEALKSLGLPTATLPIN